ncbi:hypothetical protein I4U23_005509 [Adineta vaga]|nr:hypothetical protein I4U23_005509 [Adineta vaga]
MKDQFANPGDTNSYNGTSIPIATNKADELEKHLWMNIDAIHKLTRERQFSSTGFEGTADYILGGTNTSRFQKFQHLIEDLARDDEDLVDNDEVLQNYSDFLKNIKLLNTNFNLDSENLNDQTIVLLQRVKKINGWDLLNGLMVFKIHSNQIEFALTPTQTGLNTRVVQHCIQCGSEFKKYGKSINGIELTVTSSDHLINYCVSLSHRFQTKLSQTETALDKDDIEMCNAKVY